MSMEDLDEQEIARRKKEQIEWRTKKNTSNTFLLCTTLVNILISLVIMIVLFIVCSLILFNVLDKEGAVIQVVFPIVSIVIFAGSMVAGFILYKKIARWAIKKLNLGDKLLDEVLEHFKTKSQTLEEYKQELLK